MGHKRVHFAFCALAAAPLLMGAEENGCGGAINSRTASPEMTGTWGIT